MRGDLSNITAPPFVLATKSTVEFPAYWADHPSFLVAPAFEPDQAKRALLVLRSFLISLKNQQYGGRDVDEGIKKPLNAFLGELFLASWDGETGVTRLVSEQVSHHPPVTACYIWNSEAGVRAEGYARQEITFTGSVHVKQYGHAIVHLDRYDEDYLLPLPELTVQGLLIGSTYPELSGKYHIVSSTGYISEIDFEGKGFFSRKKNSVHAHTYMWDRNKPLYTITGQWSEELTIYEGSDSGALIETINTQTLGTANIKVAPRDQQSPWESRRAWAGVAGALHTGDMKRASNEKIKIEEAQRHMRKEEETKGVEWKSLFFTKEKDHPVFKKLTKYHDVKLDTDKTLGVWRFDHEKWDSGIALPYHGGRNPAN